MSSNRKNNNQNADIKIMSLLLLFLFNGSSAIAEESLLLSQVVGKRISDILITGNKKTKNQIIMQELDIAKGDILSKKSLLNSMRKLKNLRIFESVNAEYTLSESDSVNVHLLIRDRWTIIPIAKFGGGGGSKYFTIGVFDANSFGRYTELGAQYQNINGKNGGVLWFRNPRFLGQRLLLGMDFWRFMLNQPIYDDKGDLAGAYTDTRDRIHVFTQKLISEQSKIFIGGGIDYVIDGFDDFGLTDEQIVANKKTGFVVPEDINLNYIELNMQLGVLNYDRYLVDGYQANIDTRITSTQFFSDENSFEVVVKNTFFVKFSHEQNIGVNLLIGHTSSNLVQNQFYLGGLLEVRGYVDRRFRGSDYWKSNLEYRVPSYRSGWFVLQHIVFFDFGQIANSFDDLFDDKSTNFASAGAGLRFISPKIYRFNARLDVARTFGDDGGLDFSFGLQQFF